MNLNMSLRQTLLMYHVTLNNSDRRMIMIEFLIEIDCTIVFVRIYVFLYKGQESQVWKLLCLQNLFFLFSFCSLFYDTRKTSRNKVAIAQCGP